ncbi:MAG: LPXTG cell wall anchor domain-containing protein, partial [Ruminococcus sp.]|nr:LPXTG cell wall anchor domain-containing protein [Ruminococcus sp.]
KPTTTTTTSESTTTTTTESTTTEPTITTTKPSERSIVQHIASDEELGNWSVNDYNSKHDIPANSAEITETPDGQYQITLTDDSENVLDVYEINPENGIGTDSENNEVNLPQTGNNSLTNMIIALGSLIMTASGFVAVKSSGIIRRKKNK